VSGEAANTNFIVFGLTRQEVHKRFESTIFLTRGEYVIHYTIDAVWVRYPLHHRCSL